MIRNKLKIAQLLIFTFMLSIVNMTANAQSKSDSNEKLGLNTISESNLRKNVAFLADDKLGGRGIGQDGMVKASQYMADQFRAIGVLPGGENGTYFQYFNIIRNTLSDGANLTFVSGDTKITVENSSIAVKPNITKNKNYNTNYVFAGYGISSDELGWNDYKNLDVKDKIVFAFVGLPDNEKFKDRSTRRYSSNRLKFQTALENGAAGMFLIHDPKKVRYSWDRIAGSIKTPRAIMAEADNQDKLEFEGYINSAKAKIILELNNLDYTEVMKNADNGRIPSISSDDYLEINLRINTNLMKERNVIGFIEGQIKDEYVIFSAHLDAYGIADEINGDNIYNGAVDNATGSAGLIEVGKAFLSFPEKPKRSIILIAVSAEEQFFLGSKYYTNNPTYPVEKTIANINFDELLDHGKMDEILIFGKARSTLGKIAEEIAREKGLTYPEKAEDAIGQNAFSTLR